MNQQTTADKPAASHDYDSQIAVLRSDLDRLRGDFSKLSRELAEDAGEHLHDIGTRANSRLHEKGEELRKASSRGREIAKDEVKQHPLATILAATGVTIALGALAKWAALDSKPKS